MLSLASLSRLSLVRPTCPGETGATFAANALLKARAIAAFTGLPAVSDDPGRARTR